MNMAPQELEKSASNYASEAIKHDSQGARGMAITNYQNQNFHMTFQTHMNLHKFKLENLLKLYQK